ncbi:MAG TPA: helix-turn-helix domain-containing protein [Solirubrobacteraceae bacterium]|jgi:AcrR family transcriptional regulator
MSQVVRGRLSRELILDAAVTLARRDGVGAVSMRRIAEELDVWPMSLYRHFRDKDELLDALAEDAARGIAAPAGDGPWRDEARELLRAARRAFERHPAGLRLHREPRLHDAGLDVLARAGFAGDEAASAWAALLAYAAGAAATEAGAADFEYGLERLLDGLEARHTSPP